MGSFMQCLALLEGMVWQKVLWELTSQGHSTSDAVAQAADG